MLGFACVVRRACIAHLRTCGVVRTGMFCLCVYLSSEKGQARNEAVCLDEGEDVVGTVDLHKVARDGGEEDEGLDALFRAARPFPRWGVQEAAEHVDVSTEGDALCLSHLCAANKHGEPVQAEKGDHLFQCVANGPVRTQQLCILRVVVPASE